MANFDFSHVNYKPKEQPNEYCGLSIDELRRKSQEIDEKYRDSNGFLTKKAYEEMHKISRALLTIKPHVGDIQE